MAPVKVIIYNKLLRGVRPGVECVRRAYRKETWGKKVIKEFPWREISCPNRVQAATISTAK